MWFGLLRVVFCSCFLFVGVYGFWLVYFGLIVYLVVSYFRWVLFLMLGLEIVRCDVMLW